MNESNEGNPISSKMEPNDRYNVDGIAEKLQNSFIDDGAEHDQSDYNKQLHCDRFQSRSPSEYNDVNHLFHIDFMRSIQSIPVQQKRFSFRFLFPCFVLCCCCFSRASLVGWTIFSQRNYFTGIKMGPASIVHSAMKKCVKSVSIEYN